MCFCVQHICVLLTVNISQQLCIYHINTVIQSSNINLEQLALGHFATVDINTAHL